GVARTWTGPLRGGRLELPDSDAVAEGESAAFTSFANPAFSAWPRAEVSAPPWAVPPDPLPGSVRPGFRAAVLLGHARKPDHRRAVPPTESPRGEPGGQPSP